MSIPFKYSTDGGATWESANAQGANVGLGNGVLIEFGSASLAAPTDEATREFDAARLRRLVRAVGLEKAVPTDDATLLGCLGTVLGQIAGKVEKLAASNTATAAPGDLPSPTSVELPAPHMRLSQEEGSDDYPVFLVAHMHNFARRYAAFVLASNAGAAQQPLMRQAVASVGHPVNGTFRINWMRPERVQVGSLLYCIERAPSINPPVGAKEKE